MIPSSEDQYYYKLDNMVLSSCQVIRKLFKARWKIETNGDEWVDDQDHRTSFMTGVGLNVYKTLRPQQKSTFETQSVETWDMTMLFAVINKFGDENKYKDENSYITKLKDIRNDLAHNNNKKVPENEFNSKVETFKSSLLSLGMNDEDIAKLIDRAGVTSSVKALELMKDFHAKADTLLQNGQLEKAMECYTEAIDVPSLLPVNLGTAHEKRAECYLKSVKDPLTDEEEINHAQAHVDKALELNDSSWMAHFLAAQCHRWKNDLIQALHHYERALVISPVQKEVKNDLDSCKILAGMYSRSDHQSPSSEDPQDAVLEGTAIKGQDHVYRGHNHFCGWTVPQNFTESVKHYSKAATLKNAEGMYNLAKCNHLGHGVKKDIREAFRLYMEVAKMDGDKPGVASAQFALGIMYEDGIGVGKDFIQAAMWYREAMENGAGNAANNLAILFAEGKEVQKNGRIAELCWRKAIRLKDCNATASLVGYYINQMEPEKALKMVQIGREMKNPGLINLSDEEMNRTIKGLNEARLKLEEEISQFEAHKMTTEDLTFQQRITRRHNFLNPDNIKLREHSCWNKVAETMSPEIFLAIEEKAHEGSEEASKILRTMTVFFELIEFLEQNTENQEEQNLQIVNLLYKCVTLEFHVVKFNDSTKQRLKSILANLFEEKCDKKGDEDMKIRFCFVVVNLSRSLTSEDMHGVHLLKEGIRRYPDNIHYYEYLTYLLGFKQQFEDGRHYAEEGLEMFPNNIHLLYFRAVHASQQPSDMKSYEIVEAYKKFLIVAPIDHRKVPEAYYQMGNLYMTKFNLSNEANELDLVKHYFKLGNEAEENQLACYLPYENSPVKCLVQAFLSSLREGRSLATLANETTENEHGQSVLERKEYLKNPTRKTLILQHRKDLKMKEQPNPIAPRLTQSPATKMSLVKPIILSEMNSTADHIFEDRIIDLTIMDEPNAIDGSVMHLLVEDEKGDLTRVQIYNVKRSKENLERLKAGCRIAIINPYVIGGDDQIVKGIRIDEPKCLLFLEGMENMCRFCGEENAGKKCSKCKRPYCSKECQELDWKVLNHKLICSLKY